MTSYTHLNLRRDVEDQAAKHGMEGVEGHFASRDLGLSDAAMSFQSLSPGVRQPFGHRHTAQEEVYVVVGGSGRIKLDDDILELAALDAVRVPATVWRCLEAGPDGLTFLAFGAPPVQDLQAESEVAMGWWS